MCGIAGFVHPSGLPGEAAAIADRMAGALQRRGPDDQDVWLDAASGIALVHRRLSVIDTSAAGRQPMQSHSGRYVLSCNGEIYNHLALRRALGEQGTQVPWRGHSDTETLLAAIDAWGLEEALRRCVGMFAFALWDRNSRTLSLARDRMGEKPLYCGWQGGAFVFGSDLLALRRHPAFAARVDAGALSLYLNRGYVPAPHSIYQGIRKLRQGCVLELRVADGRATEREWSYWSVAGAAAGAKAAPFGGAQQEADDQLLLRLENAVAGQLMADVPLGAFLSGGVDSSLVVALMQRASRQPVKTFTIGFSEPTYDEAPFARAVAGHLGTDHHELYVGPQDALAVVDQLPALYSEPLGDASQIPTHLVAAMARRQVTVALSGDGGDELFCGYDRYFLASDLSRRIAGMPAGLRAAAEPVLRSLPVGLANRLGRALGASLPPRLRRERLGDDLQKAAGLLRAGSALDVYLGLLSQDPAPGLLVPGALADPWAERTAAEHGGEGFFGAAMLLDMMTYLPDDILAKVDRAAMGVGLETRVPFLDHRVVEFALGMPTGFKVAGDTGKANLRRILRRFVPQALIDRPKAGFTLPVAEWLRGPLRPWGEDLVSSVGSSDLLDRATVRRLWTEHLGGQRNWWFILWNLLMFCAWRRASAT
jgi:asparagine synthase (glutamine-hydrolysing)